MEIPAARPDGIIYLRGPDGRDRPTTLNPVLQAELTRFLADGRAPVAAIVMTDVRTGSVLAMAQGQDPKAWGGKTHTALHKSFPAASVFKTVVTAAALEIADFDPTASLNLSGGCSRVRESGEWLTDRDTGKASEMSLRRAFGKSCNGYYAKIALSHLGLGPIQTFARRFGWESGIGADFQVDKSPMLLPSATTSSAHTVGSFAAGFGLVGLSAAHGAWMMQAIANDGVAKPLRLFRDTPIPAEGAGDRIVASDTARKLLQLMDSSVRGGTASFAFRRGKYKKLQNLVGGKTGTLTGMNPKGITTWFTGLAPLDRPEVAVSAVVVLEDHWRVKGPLLAAEGLYQYFENRPELASVLK